jgi:hypothetical protein
MEKLDYIGCAAGPGEPIPEHPYPGQRWAEVRHDNTVTWLAYWKDPTNAKAYKYVFLGANSQFKSESDLAKYEKARKLKVRARLGWAAFWGFWRSLPKWRGAAPGALCEPDLSWGRGPAVLGCCWDYANGLALFLARPALECVFSEWGRKAV